MSAPRSAQKQHFRGIDLVRLVGSNSPRISWAPADIMAVEAHLARHRLHLGNCSTLYFADILNQLLRRDGFDAQTDIEVAQLVSPKVKSTLAYRLRRLAAQGHVELGRGLQYEHTARWKGYTRLWAEPGWDGYTQPRPPRLLTLTPTPTPTPTPSREDCRQVDDDDDDDDNDDNEQPPRVERAAAASLLLASSPPASPHLRPQQASSEPWLDPGFGSQPTLEENLAALELPSSSSAAAAAARPASPPPSRIWEQQQQQQPRGRALLTPPRSSIISVLNNSPPAVDVHVDVAAAAAAPASPISDQYVAMLRAAEQQRAASTSPRPQSSASNPRPPPPPRPRPPPPPPPAPSPQQQQQQQQEFLLFHEEEQEQEDLRAPPPRTRPRIVGAAPFTLFRDQAKIYIRMHRCALVVLLLTNGVAGSRTSEDKRRELVAEVRQRMRILAIANVGIERRLAAISLVLAVPGRGSTAIRNLYRAAGVEYAG